jgi:hypothetical protein
MHHEIHADPRPVLRADRLYSLDNGRIACGRPHCAGMSAAFSGYTIAGQRAHEVDAEIRRDFRMYGLTLRCEMCGQRDGAQ